MRRPRHDRHAFRSMGDEFWRKRKELSDIRMAAFDTTADATARMLLNAVGDISIASLLYLLNVRTFEEAERMRALGVDALRQLLAQRQARGRRAAPAATPVPITSAPPPDERLTRKSRSPR